MKYEVSQFALLGSGRVARHFQHYFRLLGLRLETWSRDGSPEFNSFFEIDDAQLRLAATLESATHVLFAISDRALPELVPVLRDDQIGVHFSGAAHVAGLYSAHPLMTFGEDLQTLAWYKQIPFVLESEGPPWSALMPGLNNPAFSIQREMRPYYHALCSLAGNSTYLLWLEIAQRFENDLDLPRELLPPFLQQVLNNFAKSSSPLNFTGPVARADWPIVKTHLQTLNSHPDLLRMYQSHLHQARSQGHNVPEDLL